MSNHTDGDVRKARARPTKSLFIDTLTRDVDLQSAIVDLLDNSVDGARRIRAANQNDLSGLWVGITVNDQEFEIRDNCGGIPLDIAERYAFCFGLAPGRPLDSSHLIGQFGVGMKRTLFKIADTFEVESVHESSHFSLRVDVEEWRADESEEWSFPFNEAVEGEENNPEELGTTIRVSSLKDEISREFADDAVVSSLREKIAKAHEHSLRSGLTIRFNGNELRPRDPQLLTSDAIKPALIRITLKGDVSLTLLVGIGEQSTKESGWYVYCNGRLILDADKSETTGWGLRASGLPKHHQQYNRFYGFAYLDSDSPGSMPWNTAKTGMSEDSDVFRSLREQLIGAGRPVVAFLNKLREEEALIDRDSDDPELGELMNAVEEAEPQPVEELRTNHEELEARFVWPQPTSRPSRRDPMVNVHFRAERDRVEAAIEEYGAHSARDLALSLFKEFCEEHNI